jgi:hypothetical protein
MELPSIAGKSTPTQDLVLLGGLVLVGYVLYKVFGAVQATAAAAGVAGKAVIKGAQVVTAPVAAALATAWSAMTSNPNISLLGNVLWPDGTSTPIASLTVKSDTLGNVYVASPQNGLLFQLQPSDANGNWPAVQITDPSQIGAAPGNSQNAPSAGTDLTLGGATPGAW